jgi:superfamily II DNA/RNA helicase
VAWTRADAGASATTVGTRRGEARGTARGTATTTRGTFEEAGLTDESLRRALENMNIVEPTEIQTKAIDVIGRGAGNAFVASHTGSGKTLAYLLPVIQRMKAAEIAAGDRLAKPKRPKVVVACPTRELAEQVAEVAKALSHVAKFSSYLVVGGRRLGTQKERLDSAIDVVIGTPGRLIKHVDQGNLFLGSVDAMVLDEADTLFEAGFGDEVKRLLRPLKARPEGKTCVLVSATMPDRLKKLVDEELPALQYIKTDSLHRSAPGLKHRFVDCPGDVDKMTVLEQIVAPEHKQGKKLMIFCNTLPSCIAVERTMFEADIRTVQYHGDMTSDARADAMREFIDADADENLTMVCTDLAARGLDFGRVKVDHVVNFDFPMNSLDYIHRSGRTARAGAGGKVTNLVAKKDRVLASEIDNAVKLGLPIDNATSSRAVSEARKKKSIADARDRRTGGRSRAKPSTVRDSKPSNRGRRGAARFTTDDTKTKPSNRGRR